MMEVTRQTRGARLWLISNVSDGRADVLSFEHGGGRVMAVFGFREEAELFLWFAGLGEGWRAVDKSNGEVLTLLDGPLSEVDGVIFDPLPGGLSGGMNRFAHLDRGRFEDWLSRRGGFTASRGAAT